MLVVEDRWYGDIQWLEEFFPRTAWLQRVEVNAGKTKPDPTHGMQVVDMNYQLSLTILRTLREHETPAHKLLIVHHAHDTGAVAGSSRHEDLLPYPQCLEKDQS